MLLNGLGIFLAPEFRFETDADVCDVVLINIAVLLRAQLKWRTQLDVVNSSCSSVQFSQRASPWPGGSAGRSVAPDTPRSWFHPQSTSADLCLYK